MTEVEQASAFIYEGFFQDMCRKVKERGLSGADKEAFVFGYFKRREAQLAEEMRDRYPRAPHSFAMKILGARWCAHESRVVVHGPANNPVFLCFGHDGRVLSFEFRFVYFLAEHLSTAERGPTGVDPLESMNDPNPASLRKRCWRLIRLLNVPDEEEPVSLMTHRFNVMSSKCFRQEDLISITLNTSGVPLTFHGKVGSREDVVANLAIITTASGDVMPLVMAGTETMTVSDKAGISVVFMDETGIPGCRGRMETGFARQHNNRGYRISPESAVLAAEFAWRVAEYVWYFCFV